MTDRSHCVTTPTPFWVAYALIKQAQVPVDTAKRLTIPCPTKLPILLGIVTTVLKEENSPVVVLTLVYKKELWN